jgi:GGDEF domain-containing protein
MGSLKKGTEAVTRFSLLDESKKLFKSKFYDSFFINEYGKIETARSERHGSSYSVVVLHVDSFKNTKFLKEKGALLDFLKKLVTAILDVVRSSDVVGMLEDRRIIIILPETDYFGSLITIRKLSRGLEFITTKDEPYASIIFSQATYPKDANGHGELVGVALKRLSNKKESLWEQRDLKNKLFWEIVETVSTTNQNSPEYSTFEMDPDDESGYSSLDKINEMVIHEITRTPQKKGILYLGVKKITPELPIKKVIDSIGTTATKIFLVGAGEKEARVEDKNSTSICLTDRRLKQGFFTFFLNEDVSYGIICNEAWGKAHSCFHTSDPYLVEGLVMKFQRDYSLQEQL